MPKGVYVRKPKTLQEMRLYNLKAIREGLGWEHPLNRDEHWVWGGYSRGNTAIAYMYDFRDSRGRNGAVQYFTHQLLLQPEGLQADEYLHPTCKEGLCINPWHWEVRDRTKPMVESAVTVESLKTGEMLQRSQDLEPAIFKQDAPKEMQ